MSASAFCFAIDLNAASNHRRQNHDTEAPDRVLDCPDLGRMGGVVGHEDGHEFGLRNHGVQELRTFGDQVGF